MGKAYKLHLIEREEMVCDFLREALRNYSCKIKRNFLVFLNFRVGRLEEIKRNIAVLTVKKIWRAKKLTVKILREKFIKIKRRKAAMQNKEAFQKYLATMGGPSAPVKKEAPRKVEVLENEEGSEFPIEGKEEAENAEEEREFKEAQRIKAEIDRKIHEKVSKSKIAYAIEDSSVKVRIPLMQERALNEDLDVDSIQSKLLNLTASTFAKGRNLSREKQPTTRNYQISSPRSCSQRKHYEGTVLPPLPIISSADIPNQTFLHIDVKPVTDENFLGETVCSSNRLRPTIIPYWKLPRESVSKPKRKRIFRVKEVKDGDKKEFKVPERINHWIPVARRFSSYVPGVDNSGYVPNKWKPLQLDKRILSTAFNSVNTTRRHMSAAISPTAVISMNGSPANFSQTNRANRFRKEPLMSLTISTQEQSMDLPNFN